MANLFKYIKDAVLQSSSSDPSNMNSECLLHDPFPIEDCNGLYFNDNFLPLEMVVQILSFVEPKDLLQCSLVCKQWCNLIKSSALWQEIFNRVEWPKKAQNLPWYVFYCYFSTENFKNLLKNGNGQNGFQHWSILANGGDKFKIESTPEGSPPLPLNIADFQGHSSCFSTSYEKCFKIQHIKFSPIMRHVIQEYKPALYISEWYTGRFDCSSVYVLSIRCLTPEQNMFLEPELRRISFLRHWDEDEELPFQESPRNFPYLCLDKTGLISQWSNPEWQKLEITVDNYDSKMDRAVFGHAGQDRQFWAGHYGSKMAGGVVRFVLDSIKPKETNCDIHVES